MAQRHRISRIAYVNLPRTSDRQYRASVDADTTLPVAVGVILGSDDEERSIELHVDAHGSWNLYRIRPGHEPEELAYG